MKAVAFLLSLLWSHGGSAHVSNACNLPARCPMLASYQHPGRVSPRRSVSAGRACSWRTVLRMPIFHLLHTVLLW